MKLFKKVSLRLRLTILIGIILSFSCIIFMIASTRSAKDIYQGTVDIDEYISPEMKKQLTKVEQDDEFANMNVIISLMVIVLGTSASYFIAKKAIQPVAILSRQIRAVDENNLTSRVIVPKTNDELYELANSFNKMIGRLEKAFTAQKNFSANVAHELKTPLAAMIASIEVCQIDEQPSLDEYRETLNDVLQNAERLSTLVNDLLLMLNNTFLSREKINLKELFEQIICELTHVLETDIHFENQIQDVSLYGDKFLLYRAFLNLIHNAVKYNHPNGKVILNMAYEGNMVIVTITDTGIGIQKDHLHKVFEPFYCVDTSRSRQLGGSGLGLSIVKSIIEKHNGTVDVHSELGVSTTFTVCLPK